MLTQQKGGWALMLEQQNIKHQTMKGGHFPWIVHHVFFITTLYTMYMCISFLHTSEPILEPSAATMASIVRMLSQWRI